ncbi:MAG: hypothetical protein QM715_07765 [Nibricoccus sp.]
MKPLALLLALSIAANAALAFLLVRPKNTPATGPSVNLSTVQVSANLPDGSGAPGAASSIAGVDAKTWSNLQSSDIKALAERLRAAGFPPSLIRAIVAAQIGERYSAQRKALLANQADEPYWQRNNFSFDPKLMSAMRELNKQQSAEMKALLGPDAVGDEERKQWYRRQFGDLPGDKVEQLQAIVSDYGDLRNEIYSKANGIMLPEDRQKIALLEKEQRADLAAVLTPEELENYELRSSSTASTLRSQLSTFKPNEQEFRALFKALRAAEEQYGSISQGPSSPDQLTNIRDSVLASMESQLGPDRLADLKLATDPKYQQTNRLVARLGLPANTSVEVGNIQQDIQQKANAVRRDTSLSSEARTAQLSALSQEAANKLSATLTPRGYEAYKQYGGFWLQNLTPPVRRPTATP